MAAPVYRAGGASWRLKTVSRMISLTEGCGKMSSLMSSILISLSISMAAVVTISEA